MFEPLQSVPLVLRSPAVRRRGRTGVSNDYEGAEKWGVQRGEAPAPALSVAEGTGVWGCPPDIISSSLGAGWGEMVAELACFSTSLPTSAAR